MRTIKPILIATLLAGAATAATGCYANDDVQYSGSGEVAYDNSPDLVEVSPGVQVIADYDEPVFFNDGFYWRYSGGIWYSSTYWGGGWAVGRPPYAIAHIDHPTVYAHYRPAGWHPRAGGRGYARGEVRGRPGVTASVRPAPAPRVSSSVRPAPHASAHVAPSHRK